MDTDKLQEIELFGAIDNAAVALSSLWLQYGPDAFMNAVVSAIQTVQHPKGKEECIRFIKIIADRMPAYASTLPIG